MLSPEQRLSYDPPKLAFVKNEASSLDRANSLTPIDVTGEVRVKLLKVRPLLRNQGSRLARADLWWNSGRRLSW